MSLNTFSQCCLKFINIESLRFRVCVSVTGMTQHVPVPHYCIYKYHKVNIIPHATLYSALFWQLINSHFVNKHVCKQTSLSSTSKTLLPILNLKAVCWEDLLPLTQLLYSMQIGHCCKDVAGINTYTTVIIWTHKRSLRRYQAQLLSGVKHNSNI